MRRSSPKAEGPQPLQSVEAVETSPEASSARVGVLSQPRSPVTGRPRRIHLREALLEPAPFERGEEPISDEALRAHELKVAEVAKLEQKLLVKEQELVAREEALTAKARDLEEQGSSAKRVLLQQASELQRLQDELQRTQSARQVEADTWLREKHAHEVELAAIAEQGAAWRVASDARLDDLQELTDRQSAEIGRLRDLVPKGLFQRVAAWF